jgi:hypothetical protein
MWLGHDLAWWSFVLAVMALVLMVPANLFANFLTPKLKDWWAERSKASLQKRIKNIEDQLTESEITEFEELMMKAAEFTLMILGSIIALVILCFLTSIGVISSSGELVSHQNNHGQSQNAQIFAIFWLGIGLVFALSVFSRSLLKFRLTHGPTGRKYLKKSLDTLRMKAEKGIRK